MHFLSATTALLLTAPLSARASACQGDASNSCSGLLHQCTSDDELCVIDTVTGSCCTVSSSATAVARSASTCRSDRNADVCRDSTGSALSPAESSSSSLECFDVELGMILDDRPDDISWEIASGRKSSLQNPSAAILRTSPPYDPAVYRQASDTYTACLPRGKYTFTVFDRGDDGLCCSYGEGRYVLSYKQTGEVIATGDRFGNVDSTTFKLPYSAPKYVDANHDGADDRTGNVIPTIPLTTDGEPSCSNEFGLHLVTDDYGVETTWELRERGSRYGGSTDDDDDDNYKQGRIVASGGPYTSDFAYDVTYCVDPGRYTFVFYDWQCDGLEGLRSNGYYTLKVNGMEVYTGGTNMTGYEELVDLDFVNTLVGYEEMENPGSLDRYKKTASSGVGGGIIGGKQRSSIVGVIVGLVMVTAAIRWN